MTNKQKRRMARLALREPLTRISCVVALSCGACSKTAIGVRYGNPATGSVDTEYHWRHEYRSLMVEGKDGVIMWDGTEFEDAGLIEVRKDENGDWVEA